MVTQSASERGKSATAFRTIGEVSLELDLPQHVLRFWESKFSRLRPMKRGGGRRYYRPEDIDLLTRIKSLLYDDGYTIKGVQKLLREGGGKPGADEARPAPAPRPAPPVSEKTAATQPAAAAAAVPSEAEKAKLDEQTRRALLDAIAELEELRALLKDRD